MLLNNFMIGLVMVSDLKALCNKDLTAVMYEVKAAAAS